MLTLEPKKEFLKKVILKYAMQHGLEGIAQAIADDKVKIVVCGEKKQVDAFLDEVQQEAIIGIEIEPFVKDKDYRGVFRVID